MTDAPSPKCARFEVWKCSRCGYIWAESRLGAGCPDCKADQTSMSNPFDVIHVVPSFVPARTAGKGAR